MMLWLTLAAAAAPADSRFAALADPYRPGCAIGVIEGGQLVHARGYGSADISTGRAITTKTAFNIASMSKQFTAAAIGLLMNLARGISADWVKARFRPRPRAAAEARPVLLSPREAADLAGVYHDPEGDELRTFAAEGSTLKFVYFGENHPLTHLGGGRFALEGVGEFRFGGGGMAETAPTIAFTRLDAPEPRPPGDYSGRYASAEVDGRAEFRVEGGKLVMKLPGGEIPLEAIATDDFAAPARGFGRIAFLRDGSGTVTGFTLSTLSGISRLRFERD